MKDIKVLDRRGIKKDAEEKPKKDEYKEAGEQIARLQPCEDWIILDLRTHEEKTPAGLILPNGMPGQARRGKVLATGPGKCGPTGERIAMNVKVGDEVLAPSAFGVEMDFEREKCFLMRDSEVIAVVRPAEVMS